MKSMLKMLLALILALGCVGAAALAEDAVDYADPDNWAWYAEGEGKDADVFLICPTVDKKDEYNMSVDDEDNRTRFVGALNMERGLYEEAGRLFAPYYRQTSLKAWAMDEAAREPYTELAYEDVSAAFSYYLERENGGRPIILAGFSQGAQMCLKLMEEYFDDAALRNRLVAVYAIGWPCTEELAERCPWIVPAAGEDDLGVVVSFECEAPEVEETILFPVGRKAFSINPLNWRTDGTPADKSLNLGACFIGYDGSVKREEAGLCGCYIDEARGVLKVTDVNPADYASALPGMPEGSYHVFDYQFFFRNLQQNVRVRVARYLEATLRDAA